MSDNKAVRRFFAYVLMVVGGLIAVLCGGCTAIFLLAALQTYFTPHTGYEAWGPPLGIAALIVGGLPTLGGAGLFVSGLSMKRRAKAKLDRDIDNPTS